ncbi:glutathione S-transferase family protein [Phenylobacterium sp.]|uniref:glutathione S-transferase family protein n=1 Tax=Phenylobacterium sp. TaxID=1871053 RepID=UPI00301D85B5
MITLYQFATSPFCEKVRRILNFKGAPFTLVEVDRTKVAVYARVSPAGKFPAIEHDGEAVWDSTNIAHHLERAFPDPPLIPADRRAAALTHVFEDWADESLYFYEIVMRLSWEQNIDRVLPEFAAGMPGVPADALRARLLEAAKAGAAVQGLGRKREAEVVEDARRHIEALEGLLKGSDWLVGDRPGLADIAVTCQVRAMAYAREAEALLAAAPRVRAWLDRVDGVAPSAAP